MPWSARLICHVVQSLLLKSVLRAQQLDRRPAAVPLSAPCTVDRRWSLPTLARIRGPRLVCAMQGVMTDRTSADGGEQFIPSNVTKTGTAPEQVCFTIAATILAVARCS